jgi:arylsulfate sulfotransferase
VPKQGGQKISYKVSRSQLLTHGGVPVFGLYPDYLNTIRVDYTRIDTTGKKEKF